MLCGRERILKSCESFCILRVSGIGIPVRALIAGIPGFGSKGSGFGIRCLSGLSNKGKDPARKGALHKGARGLRGPCKTYLLGFR